MRRLVLAPLAVLALAVWPPSAPAAPGIVRAQATVPPGPYLFGEQVEPAIEVLVDRRLVDPGSLQVQTRFFPYEEVTAPTRTVTVVGKLADVRFRYLLQCLSLPCLTGSSPERKIQFAPPARIDYRDRKGRASTERVSWPVFREVSRVGSNQFSPVSASQATFSIPPDPILQLPSSAVAPAPSYRLSPLPLAVVFAVLAAAALAAALLLARPLRALLRRRRRAEGPELSPLERALAAVEEAARRQAGSAEHREALALLARELRRAQLPGLVAPARKLAWSEQAPSASASRNLVAQVRAAAGGAAG